MLHFLTRQRCRMAARVGVVIMRPWRAILAVAMPLIGSGITVVMAAAFGGFRFRRAVAMVQREHTTAESGDNAEHQKP